MKSPSQKQRNHARWIREKKAHMEAKTGYRVELVWPGKVWLRYCGQRLEFSFYQNRVAMSSTYNIPYMPPEDHAFLFAEAEMYLSAAECGAKEAQKQRKKKQVEPVSPTPFTDPRQKRMLF